MRTQTRGIEMAQLAQPADPFMLELAHIRNAIEVRLAALLERPGRQTDRLADAVRNAALGQGKRARPLLVVLLARDMGCASPAALDAACAIEMVHAASLVLDDLPCMDNATLRRGSPTTHAQFGEDVAILAAIALLSRAFSVLSNAPALNGTVRARLVSSLATAVGQQGLVQGQFEDLHGAAERSAAEIATTNELKTGALLLAAVEMAGLLAHVSEATTFALRRFALAAGQAFQLRDDFLDGPGSSTALTGKDMGQDQGKATLISTLGRAEALQRLRAHIDEADRHLSAAVGARLHTHRFMEQLLALPGAAHDDPVPREAFEQAVCPASAETPWPATVLALGARPTGWTGKFA